MGLLGFCVAVALVLTLFGVVVQDLVGIVVDTLTGRGAQPKPLSEEQMMAHWKEIREQAGDKPLEGQ